MARDVYLYADESGNLDYGGLGKRGATEYFGFGTAVFYDDHGAELMEGLRLRAAVTARGISLPRGFHAVDDSHMTRNQMFAVIADQAPRFDATFLLKPNAYDWVRAMGEMRLYKLAWYLHFEAIALQVSDPADNLFVVAGTFGTKARKAQAEMALADVCGQINRNITLWCGSRRRLGDFRSPTMRSGLFTVTFWAGPASGSPIRSNQHWQRSSLHGAYFQTPRHCPRSEASAIPPQGEEAPWASFHRRRHCRHEHPTVDTRAHDDRGGARDRRRVLHEQPGDCRRPTPPCPGSRHVGPRAAVRVI